MDVEKIVEKIPFFRGMSLRQIQEILRVGNMTAVQKGDYLCRDGDKSREVFVLMSGVLAIKSGDAELARIKAVDIVGEMGVVTGQPRCADMEVVENASLLAIPKIALDALMKSDLELSLSIHRNMLIALCSKLRENNTIVSANSQPSEFAGAVM